MKIRIWTNQRNFQIGLTNTAADFHATIVVINMNTGLDNNSCPGQIHCPEHLFDETSWYCPDKFIPGCHLSVDEAMAAVELGEGANPTTIGRNIFNVLNDLGLLWQLLRKVWMTTVRWSVWQGGVYDRVVCMTVGCMTGWDGWQGGADE